MNKLRASYTFLSLWSKGRITDALLGYFHVERETPLYYQEGKALDAYASKYITDTSSLPLEWGGDVLDDPKPQLRIVTAYNELCDLVGVLDCYDQGNIIELKSGKVAAKTYAHTYQVPLYMLMCNLENMPVSRGLIIRYNQNTGKQDRAILYPSDKLYEKARNFIDTLVPEIHEYFTKHDLFDKQNVDNYVDKFNKHL